MEKRISKQINKTTIEKQIINQFFKSQKIKIETA